MTEEKEVAIPILQVYSIFVRDFSVLRKEVIDTYTKYSALTKKFRSKKLQLNLLTALHIASYLVLIGFFYKKINDRRKEKQGIVESLQKQIDETFTTVSTHDNPAIEKSWKECTAAFFRLLKSKKMWQLTAVENVDKVRDRTIAANALKRIEIHSLQKDISFIHADLQSLFLPNTAGPEIYIYPTFVVFFNENKTCEVLDMKDVKWTLGYTRYVEEEKPPSDAEVVDHTFKKANMDGSMDKRFKDNYGIPVLKYGEFFLQIGELVAWYMFSNTAAFSAFEKAFKNHIVQL